MNFFEHQDQSKKKTKLLVFLLALAVCVLILLTTFLVAVTMFFAQANEGAAAYPINNVAFSTQFFHIVDSDIFLWIVLVVVSVVSVSSLYKFMQLSRGGKYVAEALGGQLINPSSQNPTERKILNVVAEMAIASGNPVPSVYLLHDNSINAFAAGLSRRDAVIGVTQGCVELLDRDELQGVMAHEFSHIENGDMRLNMRLIALLHGILVIGLVGYFILRGSRRSRNKDSGKAVILGLGLVVIGYSGTFFGNMIKSAVSRQREFLADASAVQFTRNPTGISNALKKIGASSDGSTMSSANASEFTHLFFGESIKSQFSSLMATHPPLTDRIRRVEPQWDGSYPTIERELLNQNDSIDSENSSQNSSQNSSEQTRSELNPINFFTTASVNAAVYSKVDVTDGINSVSATHAGRAVGSTLANNAATVSDDALLHHSLNAKAIINTVGQASDATLAVAQRLMADIPEHIAKAVVEPFSARALLYCLLLDHDTFIQKNQLAFLKENAAPESYIEVKLLLRNMHTLEDHHRLLLIDLSMPALKQLSESQYATFKNNLSQLIKEDGVVSLFEWCLYRIVTDTIEIKTYKENKTLKQCKKSLEVLLSAVVHKGGFSDAEQAFIAGAKVLKVKGVALKNSESLTIINSALNQLNRLKPLQKGVLLEALIACINHDKKVSTQEAELFRAIANTLNCPVPPFYADSVG